MSLNLNPERVFYWFQEISKIPRESGNEKGISDFLVEFAKERGLENFQDEAYNVIIKKPGTTGYEKSKGVIIQGHIDMVCVKEEGSPHNFEKDPIELVVDGEFLKAKDTSLGADDGIAIAYGLAILEADNISHPPIDLLATTNEETGMDGAAALKSDHLSGEILLNIDSEVEGEFLVSCAGGANLFVNFHMEKEIVKDKALEIEVLGLKSGHSGMEIIKQRGNAIKILGRVLSELKRKYVYRLADIKGGTKHNVIPQKAKAIITSCHIEEIKEIIKEMEEKIKAEYAKEEPNLKINIAHVENLKEEFTEETGDKVIDFLMIVPDGVQYMSKDIEGLVQTSLNNAVIEVLDNSISLNISIRSSMKSSLYEIIGKIESLGKILDAKVEKTNEYPAWEFERESKVRDIAVKVYKDLTGEEPKINAIHAGLECGLLKEILPDVDMISFGPNLHDVHSTGERVEIKSVENVWNFLVKLLENLK